MYELFNGTSSTLWKSALNILQIEKKEKFEKVWEHVNCLTF